MFDDQVRNQDIFDWKYKIGYSPVFDNAGAEGHRKMAANIANDDLHALDVGREQADLGVHLHVDGDHLGLEGVSKFERTNFLSFYT